MTTLLRDTTHDPKEENMDAKAIHRCPDAPAPEAVHAGRHMTRSR